MESLLAINTCYLVSFRGYGRLILKKYDVFNSIQFILIVLLLAHLESAYSLIWGSHKIWGKVVGTPWTFYDK